MWGQIMTEANSIQNFNFGFSTYKSDILVHLSQWQYWWWFWFSLVWTLYFYVILRVMQKRTFQFNPIMNTSVRGHGKWGDFLVALIPLSWCGNILVNSNFILRMIEWQNESSLFTIRVQGKQWYWVYKFDATAAQSILSAPKNIGHNRWAVITPNESYCSDSYYQALHLGAQLEFTKLYQKALGDVELTKVNLETNTFPGQPEAVAEVSDDETAFESCLVRQPSLIPFVSREEVRCSRPYSNRVDTPTLDAFLDIRLNRTNKVQKPVDSVAEFKRNIRKAHKALLIQEALQSTESTTATTHHDMPTLDDTQNFAGNVLEQITTKPLRIVSSTLNKHTLDILSESSLLTKPLLYTAIFADDVAGTKEKVHASELLWGFKQKKYKRLQKLHFVDTPVYSPKTLTVVNRPNEQSALSLKSTLRKPLNIIETTSFDEENTGSVLDYHKAIKYNRHRSELVPVGLARRLLRTKRTLVLPAHTNITVITNSYDVVHSWFIPGLGLKLDCVPGRSTHHTFYIDNIGFYYGQCAEICGRYHHHMPIRLCALPFEQFLVWWQRKGIKRMHRVSALHSKKTIDSSLVKFRYNW